MGLSELHQRIDFPIARDRQCLIRRDNVGNLKGDEEDQQCPVERWQGPAGRIGDYRAEAEVRAPVRGIPGFLRRHRLLGTGDPDSKLSSHRKQKVKYGRAMPLYQSRDRSIAFNRGRPRPES